MIPSVGINTYSDYIEYKDHGFGDGELVRYTNDGIAIGGLDTSQDYYVLKVDDNRFRLTAGWHWNHSVKRKLSDTTVCWFNFTWNWKSYL